jgi:hypothetical protein
MKNILVTFCILIPLGLFAQKPKKEHPFFRRHMIHLSPAFMYGYEPAILGGIAYSYRFTPSVALTATAQGGADGFGGITRFFVETQFNVWGERRVQPVFFLGMHLGNSITRYEKDSNLYYNNSLVGGLNNGVGIEILFGKKRWLTGLYARGLVTFGTSSIMSFNLHLQPTIAYRI